MKKLMVGSSFLVICFVIFLSVGMATNKDQREVKLERPPGIYTPEEVFLNSTSDIFLLGGVIYTNASDIDWVQETPLEIGKEIGEIEQVYKDGVTVEGIISTELPVGTKIYEPVKPYGDILIVSLNGREIRYLGLVEG